MTHNCRPSPSFDALLRESGYDISYYMNVISTIKDEILVPNVTPS